MNRHVKKYINVLVSLFYQNFSSSYSVHTVINSGDENGEHFVRAIDF